MYLHLLASLLCLEAVVIASPEQSKWSFSVADVSFAGIPHTHFWVLAGSFNVCCIVVLQKNCHYFNAHATLFANSTITFKGKGFRFDLMDNLLTHFYLFNEQSYL